MLQWRGGQVEGFRLAVSLRGRAGGRVGDASNRVERVAGNGAARQQLHLRDIATPTGASQQQPECTAVELDAADDSAFGWEHVGACALIAFLLALPTGWLELAAAWLVGALR